ncbi:MAG TPA: cell division protein SepF [Candidatus Nanoarchaeia archaeon]|nr:cell division protein SepF [Candidatus Nanoarchaeia archaeon]
MVFNLKKLFGREEPDEYVEIDINSAQANDNKVVVKPFVLKEFDDINPVLNSLREGYTIAVIDIKPLKTKDIIELKRAVAKIKKTIDAIEGKIAGFGENIILATPQFADIHKVPTSAPKEKRSDFLSG